MDTTELWLQFVIKYVFPTIAILLSIFSYRDSRKVNRVKDRLNKLEEKLKTYELEEKEKERKDATNAYIEARIYDVSPNKYRMRIWNSGKATAYNVDFEIKGEYKGFFRRDKVPLEFLDPGKSFEERIISADGIPQKFEVVMSWEDEKGSLNSKKQILTLSQ